MIKKYFIKIFIQSIVIIFLMCFIFKFLFSYKIKIKLGDIKGFSADMDNLEWSKEQLEIKSQILNGNYIDGYGSYIEITKDYICFDGHHRLSVLKQIKDPDYKITVNKLWFYKYHNEIIKRIGNYYMTHGTQSLFGVFYLTKK